MFSVTAEAAVAIDAPAPGGPAGAPLPSPPELPTVGELGFGPRLADPGGTVVNRLDARRLRERADACGVLLPDLVLAAFVEVTAAWSRSPAFTVRLGAAEVLPVELDSALPRLDRVRATARAQDTATRLAPATGYPVSFTFGSGPEPVGGALACRAELAGTDLLLRWWAVPDLFPPGVPAAMAAALARLLEELSGTDDAWHATGLVALPEEQAATRRRANATGGPLPEGLLHDELVAQCHRTPDRVAVVASDATLTYRQLLDRAGAVAAALRGHGCAAAGSGGSVVAIGLAKSSAQVVAVLGALLAGAAYLPVDPAQPFRRRARILSDAGVRFVLTASRGDADWPAEVTPIVVTDCADAADSAAAVTPNPVPRADDLAYLIYTSGSTGVPKGVMISHRAARNTVEDLNRRFHVGPGDGVLGLASLSFDLSVYDIFGPLAAGGRLVLPDADRRGDAEHWADLAARHGVTLWNSVPAQLQLLVDHLETSGGQHALGGLRLALLSGDWIPVALPDRARALLPGLRTVSLGGATEAAIWSVWYPIGEVGPDWTRIPYGTPLTNQTLHVLDSQGRDRPDWAVGELFIGGAGVAIGYLGDPEKTAYRFVTHPVTGERLYRTGDLARYHADGVIELLGREDRQVKIRGYRVEPAEVEATLTTHPAVRDVVVEARPDRAGIPCLVAYIVGDADPDQLRALAQQALPDYMVPAAFVALPRLPLSGNGKVDRNALPDPEAVRRPELGVVFAAPENDLQLALAEIWAEVIGVDGVGVDDDFFELGGNSMLATVLAAESRERLGLDMTVRLLFDEPTIRGVTRALSR